MKIKKIAAFAAACVVLLFGVWACSEYKGREVNPNELKLEEQVSSSDRVKVGYIQSDTGIITYQMESLQSQILNHFVAESFIGSPSIFVAVDGSFHLVGKVTTTTGVVSFGFLLIVSGTNLYIPASDDTKCTQSCKSLEGCYGCTLNIASSCSGNCYCNSGMGSCEHTVSTVSSLSLLP